MTTVDENPTTPKPAAPAIDWRGWLALAWAIWFGALYARMVLAERAPGLLHAIERAAEAIRTWYR